MDAAQVADVEGTVATVAVVALAALVLLRLVAPARFAALRTAMRGTGLVLGAVVALVATAGSLWFSEGAGFPPCTLCWYQRIAMYPLVLLLGIAALRSDAGVRPYALALAGAGLAVSVWHNVIETFPHLEAGGACDADNPCTIRWVEGLGFWTIPRMALVSFVLVIAALLLDRPASTPRTEAP